MIQLWIHRIGVPAFQKVDVSSNRTAKVTFTPAAFLLSRIELRESLVVMEEAQKAVENRLKIGKMKSDCDKFIDDIREWLRSDDVFMLVMNDSERETITQKFDEAIGWYESVRTAHVRFHDFPDQFKKLRALVHKPQMRAHLRRMRERAFDEMGGILDMVYTQLTENETVLGMMEGNWKFGRLWEMYNQTKQWFEERIDVNMTRCDG
jgi:hypothetical protein